MSARATVMPRRELAETTSLGPLAFPVTPFRHDGSIDEDAFRKHVRHMAEYQPPAWFVGCGTGEFAALDVDESEHLVRVAIDEVGADTPVYGGVGHGIGLAKALAMRLEQAGAAGLLLFPPTLLIGRPSGYVDAVREIASCTDLDIIVYHRDPHPIPVGMVAELTSIPSVVGIKDGLGDIEQLSLLTRGAEHGTVFLNGMPTAEVFQPALQPLGVTGYSSAVFNFVPEISWAFHRAVSSSDAEAVERLGDTFFGPFLDIRRRCPGYAISLVKTGARLRWGTPDAPRAPLPKVNGEDARDLSRLIEKALQQYG